MPTRSAYQRAELFAAEATELETSDARPAEFAASPGDWEARVRRNAEPGDDDERERQQPDEQPVGERSRDDPAADLAVAFDHLEHGVDRSVAPPLGLGALRELLRACHQRRLPCAEPRQTSGGCLLGVGRMQHLGELVRVAIRGGWQIDGIVDWPCSIVFRHAGHPSLRASP